MHVWADIAFALVFLAVGWLFWELQAFHERFRFSPRGPSRRRLSARCMPAVVLGYVSLVRKKAARGKAGSGWALMLCLGLRLCPALQGAPCWGFCITLALLLAARVLGALCAAGRLLKTGENIKLAFACDLVQCRPSPCPGATLCACPPLQLWAGAGQLAARRKSVPGGARKGAGAKRVLCRAGRRAGGAFVPVPCASAADAGRRRLCRPAGTGLPGGFPALWKTCSASLNVGAFLLKCDACSAHGPVFIRHRVRKRARAAHLHLSAGRRCAAFSAGCACCPAPRWPRPYARCVRGVCAVHCRAGQTICSAPSGARCRRAFPMPEYARQGFFELCRVAAVNIVILLAANVLSRQANSRKPGCCAHATRAVSVLTLLLLATAASKMGLYILGLWPYGKARAGKRVSCVAGGGVCFSFIVRRAQNASACAAGRVHRRGAVHALLCVLPVQQGIIAYDRMRAWKAAPWPAAVAQANSYLPFDEPAGAGARRASRA